MGGVEENGLSLYVLAIRPRLRHKNRPQRNEVIREVKPALTADVQKRG